MNRTDTIGKLKDRLEKLLRLPITKWSRCSSDNGCIMQDVLGENCPIGPGGYRVSDPHTLGKALGLTNTEACDIADAYDSRRIGTLKHVIENLQEEP